MECKTAQQLATYLAPGKSELDAEHTAALEAHVRTCADCGRRIRFAQSFDQHMCRAMKSVEIPAGLKERIALRLSPPRLAWHRRRSVRMWATAAALLVAVGIGLTWNSASKPRIDVEMLARLEDGAAGDRAGATLNWLKDQSVDFAPATPLNLRLVAGYGMSPFPLNGKNVPMMMLFSPKQQAFAKIYVIRGDDFDLKHLPNALDSAGDVLHKVIVIPDLKRPTKFAYVAVLGISADSIEPFQDAAPGAAAEAVPALAMARPDA